MSFVQGDSFAFYNGVGASPGLLAKWTLSGIGGSATMQAGGRYSTNVQFLRLTNGTAASRQASRPWPAAYSSFAVHCAIRVSNLNNDIVGIIQFENSGTSMCGISVLANGSIETGRFTAAASKTALTTSSAGVIIANTWHYVMIEVVISDTVGRVTVWVDNVNVCNPSANQDTRNGTPTTCDTIRFNNATSNPVRDLDYSDYYLLDAAANGGELKAEILTPTSDVAQGFARSTGSTNYTLVDEAQANGDTDYVQGSNVGDVDTYGFSDLSDTPTAITAVVESIFAEKTDATARSIAAQVKSGVTTSDGSNFALAATYSKFERIMTTDPNTSSAWTGSAVNALQGGPKVTV